VYFLQVGKYTISTSVDGSNWTQRFINSWTNPFAATNSEISHHVDGTFEARYIHIYSYTDWYQYVGILEIRVFEWLNSPPETPIGMIDNGNLAQGKSVVSYDDSGSNLDFPPANVTDGDPLSSWKSSNTFYYYVGEYIYGSTGRIMIDLGEVYPLGKVDVMSSALHSYQVIFSNSPDMNTATNWVSNAYPEFFGTDITNNDSFSFEFEGRIEARYIWVITQIYASASAIPAELAEIQVYQWKKAGLCDLNSHIASVNNLDIHHGIKNSLLAKLNAAQASLDKGKKDTAINQVQAFINEVLAQKNKKIIIADAEKLVQCAEKVIANISEGD
jgi:hypothetical protein